MTTQEPTGAPELAPHVSQALEDSGAALVPLLEPWVVMVVERDEALAAMTHHLVNIQHHLGAVLAIVHPNWAQDVRTVEQAREALAALTPGVPDDPT